MKTPQQREAELSPTFVRECLSYDADTGVLRWNVRPDDHFSTPGIARAWNERWAGRMAGNLKPNGRHMTRLGPYCVFSHRIAWCLHYGSWPDHDIDHLNGERADNRISNLRDVTPTENMRNKRLYKTNSSGVAGLRWSKARERWIAVIYKKPRPLERYFRERQAGIDWLEAERPKHGFTARHGL